jgi:hypothetical protein
LVLEAIAEGATAQWKLYAGATGGWRLLVRRSARTLAYFKPLRGRFLVSLALSDAQLDAAERAGVAPALLVAVRASPKLPEGRACRLEVTNARDAAVVSRLIALKVAGSAR